MRKKREGVEKANSARERRTLKERERRGRKIEIRE